MIELNKLSEKIEKPFLIIGTPMNSGIDHHIVNMMVDDFIWEDNVNLLFLCTSNDVKIRATTIIKDRVKDLDLKMIVKKDSFILENNEFFICNYLKSPIPLPSKVDWVYIHEFSNEEQVSMHFKKISEKGKKIWISTLDYTESIIYDDNFAREDKIVIFSEKSNKNIEKMLFNDNIFETSFINEVLGEFKNI
jgi:hypothetical protein